MAKIVNTSTIQQAIDTLMTGYENYIEQDITPVPSFTEWIESKIPEPPNNDNEIN